MDQAQEAVSVQHDAAHQSSLWLAALSRFGGRIGVFATFFVLHLLLVRCGYAFKESIAEPTVMWPSAGLLFAALWLSPRRFWPVFLALHALSEFSMAAMLHEPFIPRMAILFVVSNGIESIVGASVARWLISDMTKLRTTQAVQFILAAAAGALAGAIIGPAVNQATFGSAQPYLQQVQVWWLGDWLGVLVVAPVVFGWLSPARREYPELALRSIREVLVFALVLALVSTYVFMSMAGGVASLLQLPMVLVGILMYAAYRIPPRWTIILVLGTVMLCAELTSDVKGPFIGGDVFSRTAQVQTFLIVLSVVSLVLSAALAERRITLRHLRESESRYRNFVELSSEAVWRVELGESMPVSLETEQQIAWLRRHARVVECNLSYRQIDAMDPAHDLAMWRSEVPWIAIYEKHIGEAARRNYSLDGLRFTAKVQGRTHTFLTSFSGIVVDDRLVRIWGVARDVTELTELAIRLQRDQERLKTYAREIVTAEERARRATAVDLHDGIGQALVGMGMTLQVASEQSSPEVRMLLEEARTRLREIQERTRHMISDLSPPGLYDLGLGPALQWLAVYVRGHDHLHVDLDTDVQESAIKLETRVLVFKLVRELLRNVVKHAGVQAASVMVRGDGDTLSVDVADEGKGFEWQMDMFGSQAGGFGLWSIADRVQEAGGRFVVSTAPGRGSRFEMLFPLRGRLAESAPARMVSNGN